MTPDWAPLSQIFYELNDSKHPLSYVSYALMNREAAIISAVRSGEVPVRGRRGSAFDRIENHMTPYAEISVYADTVAVKLPPPGGAGGATVVDGMRQGGLSFAFAPPLRRFEYVYVEADRRAVEAWIRENALPAGWISAASPTSEVDQRIAAELAVRKYLEDLPQHAPIKTKAEFFEEINSPDHELCDRCGNGELSQRALDRVWASAPQAWRQGGRRPANRR